MNRVIFSGLVLLALTNLTFSSGMLKRNSLEKMGRMLFQFSSTNDLDTSDVNQAFGHLTEQEEFFDDILEKVKPPVRPVSPFSPVRPFSPAIPARTIRSNYSRRTFRNFCIK